MDRFVVPIAIGKPRSDLPALALIQSPNTSLKQVIGNTDVYKSLASIYPDELLGFLITNIKELLNLSLDTESTEISNRAFKILKLGEPKLFIALAKTTALYSAAVGIVNQNPPNPASLNRLVHLTYNMLRAIPTQFPLMCGFILQLFAFIGESSIISFFEAILIDQDSLFAVKKWLHSIDFAELVYQELNNAKVGNGDQYMDQDTIRVCHLMRLITAGAQCPILRSDFVKQEMIKLLFTKLNNLPQVVENERWDAIVECYDPEFFREYTQSIISEAYKPTFSMPKSKVSAFSLLTKIIKLDPSSIDTSDLPNVIIQLCVQFSMHSIMLSSVLELLKVAFDDITVGLQFARTLFPFLMNTAAESDNKIISSFAFEALEAAFSSQKKSKPLKTYFASSPEIQRFINNVLSNRRKILGKKYGN